MKQMPQPFIIPRTASPLSTGIDAASQALAMWAAKSQKDKEQEAALPGLVSFINGLDDKSKATVMSKLIAEQPDLAQKVSAKITPPSPSTQDQMSEIWRQVSTGFHPGGTFDGSVNMQRASAPPPPPPPMGMIGRPSLGNALGVTPQTTAAAMPSTYDPNKSVPGPAPAGFDPLPSEPYARALMLTNRNLNTYGEKVLSSPEYLKMVSGAALPSDKQLPAALTAYDLAPKADVVATQAGDNQRNAATVAATRRGQDTQVQIEQMKIDAEKAKTLAAATDVPSMIQALTERRASLDDFAKKGSPLRQTLINAMPQGAIAPSNEKERSDLVGANNIASLMQDRIAKLRANSTVIDTMKNKVLVAGLLDAPKGKIDSVVQSAVRLGASPQLLDYVTQLRQLREDVFGLRKYLGNSPVRSDRQINIMLSQVPDASTANSADLNRILDSYEPAVNRLIIGTQGGGAPSGITSAPSATAQQFLTKHGLGGGK